MKVLISAVISVHTFKVNVWVFISLTLSSSLTKARHTDVFVPRNVWKVFVSKVNPVMTVTAVTSLLKRSRRISMQASHM